MIQPIKAKGRRESFSLVDQFKGYESWIDQTKLPAGILVQGSKNVITNYGDSIDKREGYTLLGFKGTIQSGIKSSFDFETYSGFSSHLRSYVVGTQVITQYFDRFTRNWYDLAGQIGNNLSFDLWWNTSTLQNQAIWVTNNSYNAYGGSYLSLWNGAMAEIQSYSAGTLTISGTQTLQQYGFSNSGTLVSNGFQMTYTGISLDGLSFTGVTPTQTPQVGFGVTQGITTYQLTGAGSPTVGVPTNYTVDFIKVKDNHLYLFSYVSRNMFVSRVNNYIDYTFAGQVTPGIMPAYGNSQRQQGDGALVQLEGYPNAARVQEDTMYISVGKDKWFYTVQDQNNTNLPDGSPIYLESFYVKPLKTTAGQAAASDALVTTIFNNVAFVSNNKTFTTIGKIKEENGVLNSMLGNPALDSISDNIRNDFQSYDFTDGQAFYFNDYAYISVPKHNLVLMYNLIMAWWEAPQTIPVARFSIIPDINGNDRLIGHSYYTTESYTLFEGTNDNGLPINAIAAFSYMNFKNRAEYKTFNQFYTEGYISDDKLNLKLNYDFDSLDLYRVIDGTGDTPDILFSPKIENYLGSSYNGQQPLGTTTQQRQLTNKFRVKHTEADQDFFEVQPIYYSANMNDSWSIIAFGANAHESKNDTVVITI